MGEWMPLTLVVRETHTLVVNGKNNLYIGGQWEKSPNIGSQWENSPPYIWLVGSISY